MVKCEILEDGEKALFYTYNGKVGLKEGPKRIWLIRSKLVRLQRFTANHNEYLKITRKSGEIVHKLGPCNEFLNPMVHSKISVENCHCLNANEAVIVYKKNKKNEIRYDRRIVRGPTVYMIQPDEWLHQFTWHGPSKTNKTTYEPGIYKFEVLNFAPNQLYYNVSDVRTADDALIRIKLMIFYELKDIETMLNATKDPIADLINCCSSDVTKFTSNKTYLSFIENCYQLNEMSTYAKLVERAAYLGYEVTKVVFRGYFAAPKLQHIHDKSVEMRTTLKLEHESALQENDRKYADLKNTIDRLACEQDIELQKLVSSQELDMLKNENMLRLKLSEVENKTENLKELKIKELRKLSDNNKSQLGHLKKLKEFDVDLTEYLTSSFVSADKTIKVVKTNLKDSNSANIHFHE